MSASDATSFGGIKFENLSDLGKKVLQNLDRYIPAAANNNIKWVYEEISYDGFDNHGPESELYDLFIIIYESAKKMYVCYNFHAEEWYTSDTKIEYDNYVSYMSNKFYPIRSVFDMHNKYIPYIP